MGAMLAQTVDKEERVIYYISKKFLDYEIKYTPLEKTCLALVWATKKLRHYMLSYSVSVYSKMDPIKYLFEKPVLNGRISRWTFILSELDLKYGPLKVIKGRAVTDFLANNPTEETEVIDTWSFPDENEVHVENDIWDLYFDGASNYMGYGVGVLLICQQCSRLGIEELEKYFEDIRYVHLPREETQFADALSKLAALINIPDHIDSMPICVERRSSPAYVNVINDAKEGETEPWYTTIFKFKETGEYPPNLDMRGKCALRMLSAQFTKTDDGQLYKKMAQGVLLRCIDKPTAKRVMEEVHDGECGPHMNAHMLVRKIIRLGYCWTTMETYCCKYVRHCNNCQIFTNVQHVAPSMLHNMTSP
ncbi:uncharacterized protein LOC141655241 [Silene latifolia]|uniref:uncharacterized protein LOC141655241 n=1 Tax=Silene latifolia TaxID=37657 RepID=UPI003D7785BD